MLKNLCYIVCKYTDNKKHYKALKRGRFSDEFTYFKGEER